MKLAELKLTNFRGFKNETAILFDEMTVIVGRNDAGKSTILDALDIFFNDAPIEKSDVCVSGNSTDVTIACVFVDLPETIVLDEQHPTSLAKEYLLREDGKLEICKVFSCSATKGKLKTITARANHPTAQDCDDLLTLKITPLKARATQCGADLSNVNQTIKTELREAIWEHATDLALAAKEVDLSAETGKSAWDQIQLHLPVYALFKSDRVSTDQDPEAQDPMKAAVKETIKNHEVQLSALVDEIRGELERVAQGTLEKIQEMNPELARSLTPQVKTKNWDSLFSISLDGDDGISINKRGSGTRRLVLLNFFRAKAEDAATSKHTGTIYAIEEPETSQHPNHQLMLLDAFQELTSQGTAQVLLTTHTPTLARKVDRNHLRMISVEGAHPAILYGNDDATLEAIKATLGVLPDHDVKVFLGVEGKWDIEFLKRISRMLSQHDNTVPDLNSAEDAGSLVFIPLGGSSMELWGTKLAGLDRPEFYITDRDTLPPANPKYHEHHEVWNARANCTAYCTSKRELENYLHPDAIKSVESSFPDTIAPFDDVPLMLAEALHTAAPDSPGWDTVSPENRKKKANRAKRRLNCECADNMTIQMLTETDPDNEIRGWLQVLGTALEG